MAAGSPPPAPASALQSEGAARDQDGICWRTCFPRQALLLQHDCNISRRPPARPPFSAPRSEGAAGISGCWRPGEPSSPGQALLLPSYCCSGARRPPSGAGEHS